MAKSLVVCYVTHQDETQPVTATDMETVGVLKKMKVHEVQVLNRVKLNVTKEMHTFRPTSMLERKEKLSNRQRRKRERQQQSTDKDTALMPDISIVPEPLPPTLLGPDDGVKRRGWYVTEGYFATNF